MTRARALGLMRTRRRSEKTIYSWSSGQLGGWKRRKFICTWEGKKITWNGGKKKKKWKILSWGNESWNDSTAGLNPCFVTGDIPSSNRRVAALNSATSILSCEEKRCCFVSHLVVSFFTCMTQLLRSLLCGAVPWIPFVPSSLVCHLVLSFHCPRHWCLPSPPIQYVSRFSNPLLPVSQGYYFRNPRCKPLTLLQKGSALKSTICIVF